MSLDAIWEESENYWRREIVREKYEKMIGVEKKCQLCLTPVVEKWKKRWKKKKYFSSFVKIQLEHSDCEPLEIGILIMGHSFICSLICLLAPLTYSLLSSWDSEIFSSNFQSLLNHCAEKRRSLKSDVDHRENRRCKDSTHSRVNRGRIKSLTQ